MGSFNVKDVITNNDIFSGEKIKAVILKREKNWKGDIASEVYITDKWTPVTTHFSGVYNDYGSMEEFNKEEPTVKMLEEKYELPIEDIFTIILEDRNMYSTCSNVIDIFRKVNSKETKELIETMKSYNKVTFDMLKKCDNRFNFVEEKENGEVLAELKYSKHNKNLKLKLNIKKSGSIYVQNFEIKEDKEIEIISVDSLGFNTKKSFPFEFSEHKHISDFFEELAERQIELVFTLRELKIVKELKQMNIMFFSEKVLNFTNNNIGYEYRFEEELKKYPNLSIFEIKYNKYLKDLEYIKSKISEKIDEEVEYYYSLRNEKSKNVTKEKIREELLKRDISTFLWDIEQELYKHPILFSDRMRYRDFNDTYFKELFSTENPSEELMKNICEFMLLNKHMETMNIVYRPSNYSGQERERDYELKWAEFLCKEVKELNLENLISCGEGFEPDSIKEGMEKDWLSEGESYLVYCGEYDGKLIEYKDKKFYLYKTETEIDLLNSCFKYMEYKEEE